VRRKPFITLCKHLHGTGRIIATPIFEKQAGVEQADQRKGDLESHVIPTMRAGGDTTARKGKKKTPVAFYR